MSIYLHSSLLFLSQDIYFPTSQVLLKDPAKVEPSTERVSYHIHGIVLPLIRREAELVQHSCQYGEHHGRRGRVRDPHGQEGRRHHEAQHDPKHRYRSAL